MKSAKAKVLHHTFFQPMVSHVIQSAADLNPLQIAIVIGHQRDAVREAVSKTASVKKSKNVSPEYTFITQKEQLGTGHAVLAAKKAIREEAETILILCGDTPLIRPETLQRLYTFHTEQENDITLLTTTIAEPFGYGRIITDGKDGIQRIVEEKDADDAQRKITTVNAGIYCVQKDILFSSLGKVGTDNKQNEMYLTDIIEIGVAEKRQIRPFHTSDMSEVLGVNSRNELAKAEKELQMRRNQELMAAGVTMITPETIRISPCSHLGKDCLLEPLVTISEASSLGENCHIEQGTVVKNSRLGRDVCVGAGAYIANADLPDGTVIAVHTCLK